MTSVPATSAGTASRVASKLAAARIRFVVRAGRLLARYPGVARELPYGLAHASASMEARVIRTFVDHPHYLGTVGGARIHLNPRNTLAQNASMAVAGWYEPPISEIVRSLVRPGGCVIDGGANVGWYTFLAAAGVGPRGHVLAFEPAPENIALLSRSLDENPRPQVALFPVCLSDHDGEETLFLSEEASSFHSIARQVGSSTLIVPSKRLDTVVGDQSIRQVDLLKVDVEGGEPNVLHGALGSVRAGRVANIILEWRTESWASEAALWNELASRYRVYRIVMSPRLREEVRSPTLDHVISVTGAAGRHGRSLHLQWRGSG